MSIQTLNPGSEAAIREGCMCPVIENHFGKGIEFEGKIEFWMSEDCPLHGFKAVKQEYNS